MQSLELRFSNRCFLCFLETKSLSSIVEECYAQALDLSIPFGNKVDEFIKTDKAFN